MKHTLIQIICGDGQKWLWFDSLDISYIIIFIFKLDISKTIDKMMNFYYEVVKY
jgi:hypothetical protein